MYIFVLLFSKEKEIKGYFPNSVSNLKIEIILEDLDFQELHKPNHLCILFINLAFTDLGEVIV